MQVVPPAKTRERVEEYVFAVRDILKHFPKTIVWQPQKIKATTFTSRLRDAIGALMEYPEFDLLKPEEIQRLKEIRKDFEILCSLANQKVICRQKRKISVAEMNTITTIPEQVTCHDKQSIIAYLTLVANQKLPTLEFENTDMETISAIIKEQGFTNLICEKKGNSIIVF